MNNIFVTLLYGNSLC